MQNFSLALMPVLLVIAGGFVLKKIDFLHADAWAGLERITYFFLFPCLLIGALGNQHLAGTDWQNLLKVIGLVLLLVSVILVVWFKIFSSSSGAVFTSVFQGGVRFNTYITLSVATLLYGEQGLVMGSIAAGFLIFIINLLCVTAFAIWGDKHIPGFKAFFREIVSNPLIIACAIGWFLSISGTGLNVHLADTLELLGRAALPLGLLTVGAALNLSAIRHHAGPVVISSLVQFGVKPVAAYMLAAYFGLGWLATGVLLIAFMTPTSPSSYILSRQLGGDAQAMASIITFQTLAAFVIMPLLAGVLLG